MPFVARRLPAGESVDLDRLIADPHWQSAPGFDAFVERTPVNGGPPHHATRVQVLVGDRALFVAVRAFDPQPQAIRARLGSHDSVAPDQDQIQLFIDSVGSRKAAQYFVVNPLGSTADGMYTAETDYEDPAPDYDFQTRAQRDADGYTAVFRLPFSTLRCASARRGEWRMMVRRIMPRDVAYEFTSALIPNGAHSTIANIQSIDGFENPSGDAFMRVTPGISVTFASARENAGPREQDTVLAPSLDIKWRPLSEVIVDATLKPDFSQVELDVPQLRGNTRFALELQEKRPFFQESADLWQMPTPQLYTRAITAPNWGMRATRRTDRSVGTVFVTDDQGGGVVLLPATWGTGYAEQPASHVAATRVRWDSNAGHMALMGNERRYADDQGANSVVGADFSREWSGFKLRGQLSGSRTTALPDARGGLTQASGRDGNQEWLALNQRSPTFESSLEFERISADFRNDTGFVSQSGVSTVTGDVNRIWRNRGSVTELWLYLMGARSEALRENISVYEFLRPGFNAVFESGLDLTVEPRLFEWQRVEPGSSLRREHYLHLELQAHPSEIVPRVSLSVDAGDMTDFVENRITPAHRLAAEVEFLANRRSSVSLALQHQGDEVLNARHYSETAVQIKANLSFTATQELRFIGSYQRLRRDASPADPASSTIGQGRTLSLTYWYTHARYRAFYLGVTDDRGGYPGHARSGFEAFMKLIYAFEVP